MAAKLKALVIVESPAKAKKIGEFLGKDYAVRASLGHVRDLPAKAAEVPAAFKKESWSSLGVNVNQDFEPLYVISPEKKKVITELKDLLKDAAELIVATDEDREGESIGWHLVDILKPKVPIKRMVFSEITKSAILDALKNTRTIDANLVEAQETRRIVDRLYGYTLSPLLWKKIARGLSAGRVQSVAVRVLVQRELERMAFRSGSYWDLKADLSPSTPGATGSASASSPGATGSASVPTFSATMVALDGKRLASGKDFDESTGQLKPNSDVILLNEKQARDLHTRLFPQGATGSASASSSGQSPGATASPSDQRLAPNAQRLFTISDIEEKEQFRKPPAPFITSTLQQEANRKFGLSSRQTMQVAQRLYEDGYITYMRTDSVNLSTEALNAARKKITTLYGDTYLHAGGPRQYTSKAKNAQEAHEAIRPAGTEMKTVEEHGLSGEQARLYGLIWKRTMASQMADAKLRFQTVTIKADNADFRATGRRVEFPGFFRAYVEGVDDPEAAIEDQDENLPPLTNGQKLTCVTLEPIAHETKPPARYTEASLTGKLEAEGVGRPSTYASIISTIQDRGYVRKDKNQLIPTFTALAVTKLLEKNFPQLVDLAFTAEMEQSLDDISTGNAQRLPYLRHFYSEPEVGLEPQVKAKEEGIDPREACTLQLNGITPAVRVGKFGPYLERIVEGETQTASLPDSISPADINDVMAEELFQLKAQGPKALGMHPEDGVPIYVKTGPFGPYLEVGQQNPDDADAPKPKRVSVPKNISPTEITLDTALKLLELPKRLGMHPEDGKVVNAGIGRFGPYVQHSGKYASLGKEDDILQMTMDRAVELLAAKKTKAAPTALKELGDHPEGGKVAIFEGRYGPYIKHGKTNATLPKDTDLNSVTLQDAIPLLAARATKGGKKAPAKKATKKAAKKSKS
ncbi:type I DNA topoisomerase [Lacunimicrobium album]